MKMVFIQHAIVYWQKIVMVDTSVPYSQRKIDEYERNKMLITNACLRRKMIIPKCFQ
jgi:hypothetical protein